MAGFCVKQLGSVLALDYFLGSREFLHANFTSIDVKFAGGLIISPLLFLYRIGYI